MGKICAPVRDEQIQKLGSMTDVVPIFKGIMEVRLTGQKVSAKYTSEYAC